MATRIVVTLVMERNVEQDHFDLTTFDWAQLLQIKRRDRLLRFLVSTSVERFDCVIQDPDSAIRWTSLRVCSARQRHPNTVATESHQREDQQERRTPSCQS